MQTWCSMIVSIVGNDLFFIEAITAPLVITLVAELRLMEAVLRTISRTISHKQVDFVSVK